MPDDSQKEFHDQLFRGLRALTESSFPKTCANCGRVFRTVEQFLLETVQVRATHTGLKEALEEDGSRSVEVYRNCPCGSTLMDVFGNRREGTDSSAEQRKRFDALLELLSLNGLERETARHELLKEMRGGHSDILAKLRPVRNHT
jgi:hypothetical protein